MEGLPPPGEEFRLMEEWQLAAVQGAGIQNTEYRIQNTEYRNKNRKLYTGYRECFVIWYILKI